MKTAAFVLALTACMALSAHAESIEPATAAGSEPVPGLGLDPAGGAVFEIPATTFT